MGQDKLSIRLMRFEDIADILELESGTLTAWSREQLEDELRQQTGVQYVACSEGAAEIQGVLCSRIIADEAEILKVSVAEYVRNKGVGNQLLDFALRFFSRKGVKNCFLELRRSNTAARYLYEKKGFIIVGSRRNYYDDPVEDAILMQRKLQ